MRTVLDNGLTVVIEPDHRSKVVALQLWVQVGSADEAPDEAGLAHLHEHMLFKGTERRGPGDLAREVEACGGDVNAWTSFDETVYHLVLSSAFWREGLDLLADAAANSTFDADELARESEVVCEEIRRNEDSPSRQLSRLMFSTAFEQHPYGRPVIGSEASVRSFTREKVLAFYRRHYTAGRMTLVITGDVDSAAALEASKAAFATLRPGTEPRAHTRLPEPARSGTRAGVKVAQLQEGRLSLAFRGPELRHPDAPALDLLAVVLAQGNASRLEHRLRLDLALVNGVTASAYTPMDPGLFTVTSALPMANVHAALRVMGEEIERLRREPVSEDELARAKRSIDVSFVHQRETVEGIARQHGYDQLFFGGPEAADAYHQAACDCTAADLLAAARRWLGREQLTVVALVDEASGVSEASLLEVVRGWPASDGLSQQSSPATPYVRLSHARADASEPRIHREALPGGATLVVRPERATPMVSLRAAWQGGLRLETPANVGAHQLLSRSLTRGTRRHDARQFSEEVDALGATVGGEAGRNSYGVRTDVLAVDLARGLDLFTDLLFHPTLDEAGVGGERAIQLEEVRSRDDNPSRAAFLLFAQKLFCAHPYAMDALGTPESLASLTGPALKSYFESSYGLEGLVIAVAGDVDPVRLRDLLLERLADVPRRPIVPRSLPAPHRLDGPVEAVRRLDRKQAHLVVGFRGISLLDEDRHALSVLQTVLGGQGGRLFAELREKRSLCYSVAPTVNEGLDPGHFGVYIGTSPDKVAAARQGIREQLERIVQEPVSESELHRARRQLVGGHDIGLQQLHARAAVMALEECYGLGAEAHLTATEHVLAVTREDVLRVARRLVDFDRCVTALVTPDA